MWCSGDAGDAFTFLTEWGNEKEALYVKKIMQKAGQEVHGVQEVVSRWCCKMGHCNHPPLRPMSLKGKGGERAILEVQRLAFDSDCKYGHRSSMQRMRSMDTDPPCNECAGRNLILESSCRASRFLHLCTLQG